MTDLTLGEKLDPRRFTAMSPKMAAIVGAILGDEAVYMTEPTIAEIIITSDGMVLARHEGEVGASDWIGSASDLDDNLLRLVVAAELTPPEAKRFGELAERRITDFRVRQCAYGCEPDHKPDTYLHV